MSQQVSPLRQRMIDDMTIRNMSPLTQKAYVRAVKNFSLHFMKSPDKLTFENVREYHLHLVSRGLSTATIIPIICGIRFFYGTTLGRPNVAEHLPLGRKADTLPSRPSRSKLGVEPLEFDAGVGGCELPIGFGVMLVSMGLPGCDLAFEG